MAEPRSTAQEAGDPSTSPERLLELTEKHPQLQRLIVQNPSTPDVARQWILATNPWAKQAYEQSLAPAADADGAADEAGADSAADADDLDLAPTALHSPVPDEHGPGDGEAADEAPTAPHGAVPAESAGTGSTASPMPPPPPAAAPLPSPATGPQDPEEISAWGDFPEEAGGTTAPGPSTSTVRIARDAGVVPLGPAPSPGSSPASAGSPAPVASASPAPAAAFPASSAAPGPTSNQYPSYEAPPAPGAYGAAAGGGYGAAADAAGPQQPTGPSDPFSPAAASAAHADPGQHDGSGTSRRAWYACGGCLLLALILLVVVALVGRAWLGGDDEEYQRDSSTTAAESTEPPAEETTEATPSQEPVSPAPDGAQEMTELHSPTGNITCLLEEDSVACSVVERDFDEAGLEDCENGPFSIEVAGEEAARACGSSFLSDTAEPLEYDQSATYGNMACTSRFDGMTCWNTMTGKGFMVNRATYETF